MRSVKLKTFILVSVIFFGLFTWANLASWSLPYPMEKEGALGKKVWQKYNCVSCHSLFGNGGYVAEDLTHVTMKRNREELQDFFRNPPILRPSKKKHHMSLTEKEAQNLINYLEYLNNIPTLGWPPAPMKLEDKEGL
jgi:nitric oxide reductase subunit C